VSHDPGPRGFSENVKAALWMRRDTLGFYEQSHQKWGPVFKFRLGPQRMALLYRPDDMKAVLVDKAGSFEKSARVKMATRAVIGEGVFTADGEKWKRNRRIVQPLFSRAQINGFAPQMVASAEELVARVAGFARSGEVFDGAKEVTRMALWVALRCFFGVDDPSKVQEFGDAVEYIGEFANAQLLAPLPTPAWLPTPLNRKFQRYARAMRAFAAQLVAERRVSGAVSDLVGRLIAARDEETGQGLDQEQIIDELLTFYAAGHDTTANGLSFTLDLLARHPEVQARVREEVARVLGGRTPTADDVPRLIYTRHVFEESLRLFPPAWTVGRTAITDEEIGGVKMPRGTNVLVNIWFAQRDPAVWERPLEFDPDRFDEARAASRPKLSYLPFGAGQRQCIGAGFSLMEGTLGLAMLLREVHLEAAGEPAQPWVRFILSPRGPVKLRARAIATSRAAVA
jgi:cytochrome P450